MFQLIFILSLWVVPSLNAQHLVNKTKRTLANEVGGFGDPNTFWLYTDTFKPQVTPRSAENVFASSKPLAIVELQPVKIVDPPKEIPQSALYDIQQQDPSNIVPNVKQLFPTEFDLTQEIQHYRPPILQNPLPPHIATSETIVSPVQHNHIIRNHNHHFTPPKPHPLYNFQPTYHIPKKYAYVNGKIIYDPNAFQIQHNPLQTTPNYLHSAQTFHPQHLQKQQLINYHNRHIPRPNLTPPAIQQLPQIPTGLPAITKFQPPKLQPIDTPSQPLSYKDKPQQHKKKENSHEEKPVNENEEFEDDSEENSPYNDEEHESYEDDEKPFSEKYSFDEEDSDHVSYRDEEELDGDDDDDDDSKRGSTRTRYVKTKKYPKKKYRQGKKSELYYSGKYEYPDKQNPKKNTKRHKMHYKGYKIYKNVDDPEAGFSENVPVVHKQKVLKEKWFVSKSSSDKKRFDE